LGFIKKKTSHRSSKKVNSEFISAYHKLPQGKHFLFHVSVSEDLNSCEISPYLVEDEYNISKVLEIIAKYFLGKFITTNRVESTFNSFESSHTTTRGRKTKKDWEFDTKLWVYFKNLSKGSMLMDHSNNISNLIEKIIQKIVNKKKIGVKAVSILNTLDNY